MIYLHLGVHKTATTYLQDLFALNQGRIAEAGRAYWRRDQIRSKIEYGLNELAAQEQGRKGLRLFSRKLADQNRPMQPLCNLLAVPRDIILSNENMLGHASDSLAGRFYPKAHERLSRLRDTCDLGNCEIWLCVREYSSFLASLYMEALRHGYYAPLPDFVQSCSAPKGQWPSLVSTIHSVFPESRLVIWRYEDFRRLEPVIIRRLTGLAAEDLVPLGNQNVRPSASARAIDEHCRQAKPLSRPERMLSMLMLEQKYPLGTSSEKFAPWPAEIVHEMQAAYHDDVEALAQLDFIEMLRP